MKRNTITYSALRASEQKTDTSFYEELSYKTLLTIGQMVDHNLSKNIKILNLKERMGINFAALAKIAINLKSQNYINLNLTNTTANVDSVNPEDLIVSLTNDGLNLILKKIIVK